MNKQKECLIVIASFADGYLDNLLTSIEENTKDVDYEIQVVDNHKDNEKLNELVIPVCKKHNVSLYLNTRITGYGDALNTGVDVNNSESKYILYIDSDTLVRPKWLRNMIDSFEKHKEEGCYMVGPMVQDFNNKYLPGVYEHYDNPEEIGMSDIEIKDENKYLIGVCILRERNTLKEFKWDKNYLRAYHEDDDLTAQVRFLNKKIFVCGSSLMHHKVNSSHETIKKEGSTPQTASHANLIYMKNKWKYIKENDVPLVAITGFGFEQFREEIFNKFGA